MPVTESLSIDAIIDNALRFCEELPETPEYLIHSRNIRELRERLAYGRLHIAVLGQFNRGKSSFINAMLGMQILPISVLPITSVPTVIKYGETNQCNISFSDDKEDAIVKGDPEAIIAHLSKYVTENNNPKNHLRVSEAVVRCKSSLLQHGTVIIDTPGFGSTLTHNTQTTLDLLSSCDAALFLFSADLPITQVEVEFLKNVIQTVPRIFFIYNKTDILNSKERKVSEEFIKDTLVRNLGFTIGVRLFPVSAKKMANREKDSDAFIKSGLAKVEKEIIDFLLREKYFALSEALTNKFRDALTQIISLLENNLNEVMKPIKESKKMLDRIEQLDKTVHREMNKALSLSDVEKKALFEHCRKLTVRKKEDLRTMSLNRLKELLISISGSKPDTLINAALFQLFEEMLSRLFLYLLTEINKPLRNAAIAHIRELKKLADNINTELDRPIKEDYEYDSKIEQMQIDTSSTWKADTSFILIPPKKSLFERFIGSAKRYKRLLEQYSPQLLSNIDTGLKELSNHINDLISSVFETFVKDIKNDYNIILQKVDKRRIEEEALYKEVQKKVEPELTKLDTLINGFKEIENDVI